MFQLDGRGLGSHNPRATGARGNAFARHTTRFPTGICPGIRKVFTSSPSPQTIIPGNRLYQAPSGTSRSLSSHAAISSSCSDPILRSAIRSRRC